MKNKRWLILPVVMVMMVVAGVIGATRASFSDPETSTNNALAFNWYDFAWLYRKPIAISNGVIPLTNYQFRIVVNTQELIGAGKMQSNGNDIRFTNGNGMTSIYYWLESGINTTSTVIWVKVPSIPAGSSTIYMYYGNGAAAAASSGDNTFIFFDNFEVDLTKWTIVNPANGTATRDSTQKTNGTYSMKLVDTSAAADYGAYANFTAQTLCVIEYDIRQAQANRNVEMQVLSTATIGPRMRFSSTGNIQYYVTSWTTLQAYSANTWYSFKLDEVYTPTAIDTYDIYINSTPRQANARFNNNADVASLNRIEFISTSGTPTWYVDLVKVRAYAAAEPSYSIGTEE